MGNLIGALALVATIAVVGFILWRERQGEKADDYFAGKKPTPPKSRQDDRDWPAIVQDARNKAAALARPAIALTMAKGPVADDAHSSIGGRPSLPADAPWPQDANGKPMIFLAQINYADMPPLDGYPAQGVLSFFVMDDNLNGCAFPSLANKGFHVAYHEDAEALVRQDLPDGGWEFTPFNDELTLKGRRLTGQVATGPVSPNSTAVRELTEGWYPDCPGELWDTLHEDLTAAKPSEIYYGGHPDFTQEDFRRTGTDPELSEVLLQLGFVLDRETGVEICWGDTGEACFLTSKADLADRRFDKVAYNWDCS
ncbi:YwqG family protein [Yoonia sp. R2-816]|uniref:YwqG family protein n=1 Tax=Yoonia sp. R2-816 TaxID=3342638 RepID=UPI00372BCFD6